MRVYRVFMLVLTLVMAAGVFKASAADCTLPPTLSMIAPAVGIAGTALNITIIVKPTTGGRNCQIRSWTLAYGDGVTQTGTNKGTFTYAHTYATAATFTVQISATTVGGKYAAVTKTIVVSVAQLPSFVVTCPNSITVASADGNPVAVSYAATTTGGTNPITIIYAPASGSFFPVGLTTVAVNATSNNGQTSSCAFTVTVTYTAPPGGFTYYVSTSGNDINTCTQARSLSTPRKTIAQGVACMGPGDRLLMRAGTYTATSPTIVVPSGVSWNAATWIGRYGTESVVLAGNPFKTFNASVSYVIFDGFIIDGSAQRVDGVAVGQGSDHIRFSNIEVRNVASNGFTIAGTDVQIINCYIHDGGTTDFDDAIYLSGNQYGVAHNAIVSGTTITKWAGAAIYMFAPGYAMDDSIIRGNTISDTSGGVAGTTNTNTGGYTNGFRTQGIVVQNANRTLVYNNLIYALRARTTPRYAILAGNASADAKIMNNTIANNPTEGIELYSTSGSTLVVNNILSSNTLGNVINQTSGVTFTTNVCQVSGTGCDAVLVGSAAFVNAVSGDYHIQLGSEANDTGTTQGDFSTDKDGVSRPQDAAWDVGAYEVNVAPTNLTAVAVSTSQINLTWTDHSSTETGFKLESSEDGAIFGQFDTVGSNVVSYSDGSLTPGTQYWYRTRAYNANGNSAYSNVASATTPLSGGTSCSGGTCYYVSITGSDSSNGLTAGTAFRTIQKAANVVNAGDTVLVADGVYIDDDSSGGIVSVSRGGTSGHPVTFRSIHKWGARISGKNFATNHGWSIYSQYVVIQDFEMYNIAYSGGDAIDINADHVSITGNWIHHIGRVCTDDGYGLDGILVNQTDITIDGNLMHDIGRLAPGENGCSGLTTTNYENHDHGVYVAGGDTVMIRNNIFYNINRGWALQIYPDPVSNLSILNNTFAFPNPYRDGQILFACDLTNALVENNIFYSPTKAGIRYAGHPLVNVVIRTNMTYGGTVISNEVGGTPYTLTGNVNNTNPLFVNVSLFDFHLQSGSPAVNTGTTNGLVTIDFSGVARPVGIAYDMGAYER